VKNPESSFISDTASPDTKNLDASKVISKQEMDNN